MATLIGVVSQVVGEVFAVASDGSRRPISEGDRVYAGEQLVTGASGAVAVAMSNGQQLTLGRDSSITLDAQMLASGSETQPPSADTPPSTAPSDDDLTDVERLQAAIEAGVDPTLEGEATAAGPGAGAGGAGGVGGGHSFVLLGEVGGALDPVVGYPTEGISGGPEFPNGEPQAVAVAVAVAAAAAAAAADGIPTTTKADNAVDEEGLAGGVVGGPGDLDGEPTQVSGLLGYDFGSDGAGSFTWSSTGLVDQNLSSGGVRLSYTVSDDGLTLSAQAGGNLVFVVQLTDLVSGVYQFELFAPLDHPAGTLGGSDENDILLSLGYSITDGSGTQIGGTLSILVDDDSPQQILGDVRPQVAGLVHEDVLPGGNAEPGSVPAQTSAFSGAAGSLDALVDFGADGRGSFSLSTEPGALSGLQALNLSSGGVALSYSVSADGGTLSASVAGAPVFTLVVGADGSYSFTLQGPLDHPLANGSDSETLGGSSLALDFSALLLATDFDGDAVAGGFASGSFVIDIEDDVPTQAGATGQAVIGLVHEDVLSNGNAEGGGQVLSVSGGAGTLDALVSFGADGRGGFALSGAPAALASLQGLGLSSGGVALSYSVSVDGSTLSASAVGAPVFTLVVGSNGSYSFTLQGPLDHPLANGSDIESLGSSGLALDFSALLVAIDGDGDPIVGGFSAGRFVIDVQDDVPISNSFSEVGGVFGLVHEDALGNGNTESAAQVLSVSGSVGSLGALVSFGADGPGSFSLSSSAGALSGLQALGLSSGGVALSYSVSSDGSTLSATAGGAPVFTLVVGSNSSYSFTLQGPLDHPLDNGSDLETLGSTGLALDFSALLVATDGDGDPLAGGFPVGSFVIDVEDDVPLINELSEEGGIFGLVHEDALGNGNRESVDQMLSVSGEPGTLDALVSFGADGRGGFSLSTEPGALSGLQALGLSSSGALLSYSVSADGSTLSATGAGGAPVFSLVVDTNGSFSFNLQGPVDHPLANGSDAETLGGSNLRLDFSALLLATDGDGDPAGGSFAPGSLVIDIEDDVPTLSVGLDAERLEQLDIVVDETVGASDRYASNDDTDTPYVSDDVTGALGQVTTQISGGLGALFSLGGAAGADGQAALSGTLSFAGVPAGGLATTLVAVDGGPITLFVDPLDSSVILGLDGTSQTVFSIAIINTGDGPQLQTTLFEALVHDDNDARLDEVANLRIDGVGALELVYEVTRTDGDDDAISATGRLELASSNGGYLSFQDDGPRADVTRAPHALDDEGLANGINGGTGDVSGTNTQVSGTLVFDAGVDGLRSIALTGPEVLGTEAVTSAWDAATNTLSISSSRGLLVSVTLTDPALGEYQVELHQALRHPSGLDENDIDLQIGYVVTDGDGDSATGQLQVTVDDDTPTMQALQPGLESQVTYLGSDAGFSNSYGYYTVDGSGNPLEGVVIWSDVHLESVGASFDLSGLDPSNVGFFIIPNGGLNADLVNGSPVTFELDGSAQWQAMLGGVPLVGDGGANVLFDRAEFNPGGSHLQDNALPGNQNWEDLTESPDYDYNDVSTNVSWGLALQVDETLLGTPDATASVDFSSAFNGEYGADVPGDLTYDLVVSAQDSGLLDTASGQAVMLSLNGNQVEGRTQVGGDLVFTLAVDSAGVVTLTQLRAIVHPTSQPDELLLLGADKVGLQATITDSDGDEASASIDLGLVMGFRDDGPSAQDDVLAGEMPRTAQDLQVGHIDDLLGNDSFGEDGRPDVTPVQIIGLGSQGGSLEIDAAGNLIYSAAAGATQGSETFTYRINDRDGDSATATLTLNLAAGDPVGGDGEGLVDEDGLLYGIADGPNDADGENASTSGTLGYEVDNFGSFAWDPSALGSLSSGGLALSYQLSNDDQTLTAFDENDDPVFELELTDPATGQYRFELFQPLDHPAPSVPGTADENDLLLNIGYQVWDAGAPTAPASGSLAITVDDDSPASPDDIERSTSEPQGIDTNLMVILDLSGSMDNAPPGVSAFDTKLALARDAVQRLVDSYDGLGDVMVRIVTFNSSASPVGGVWMTAAEAQSWLSALSDNAGNGSTNYDDALIKAMDAFGSSDKLTGSGVQNVAYFLSDGQPTLSNANPSGNDGGQYNPELGDGIDAVEEAAWTSFLDTNDIRAFSLGMGLGSPLDKTLLDPIAYDGITGTNTGAILVSDLNQLNDTLQGTVSGSEINGNLLSEGGNGFGADGQAAQPIFSIVHAGMTYGSGSSDYDGSTQTLTFTTDGGATFSVNLVTGDYSYRFNQDVAEDLSETFRYTLVDGDGDGVSADLVLTITDSSEVQAYDNYNVAEVNQELVDPSPVVTVLANFSTSSNSSVPGNPWIFDASNDFPSSDDERTVVESADVLSVPANRWGVSDIASNNNSNGVRVQSGTLQLRDTDSSAGDSTQVATPSFSIDSGAMGTLSFDVAQGADNPGDQFSWRLYSQSGSGWSAVSGVSSETDGPTIRLLDLSEGTYRLLFEANDVSSGSSRYRVNIDNITLVTVAAGMLVDTAVAASGNVLTDPSPSGNVDSKGSEGAVLSIWDGSSFIEVTGPTTVAGSWGSLEIDSDGAYTYTPEADHDNAGEEDSFIYRLTQPDGDMSEANLVIAITSDTPVVPIAPPAPEPITIPDDTPDDTGGNVLQGLVGNDWLEGTDADEVLIGAAGDDVLIGGGGSDTFVWNAGDQGGYYRDVVMDFGADDALDLSHLLVGLSDTDDADELSQYLSFDFISEPGSTVINVASAGSGTPVDQTIILENTILSGGNAAEVIQGMLDHNQLVA